MKKVYHGKSKLSGKGFYIALAICLLAIAIATTIAISRTVTQMDSQSLDLPNDTENITDVTNNQSEVPRTSGETGELSSNSATSQANSNFSTTSSSQQTVEQTAAEVVAESFCMPLSGEIINGYSNGELVKSETLGDWRTHDGWDIAAAEATPVKACGDGVVSDIKQDDMWGTTITIDHGNGVQSFYYGLNPTIQVTLDQKVSMGDVIGSVGDTNQMEIAEESHLHFGMKKDGKWVDPAEYIESSETE